MREIGISPRFSRDKFVPLQTKQRYSTRDISGEVFLTLFFRGFVPFLSLADFVSRDKNLQVVDLQRLKSCFGELVTATTSNHQKGPFEPVKVASHRNSLVWKITSSISSSKMLMPKSDNMLLLSAITPYLFIFKSLSSSFEPLLPPEYVLFLTAIPASRHLLDALLMILRLLAVW